MTAPESEPAAGGPDDEAPPPLSDASAPPTEVESPASEPLDEAPPVMARTIGFRFHGSGS